jgi:hypothetical protein
MSKLLALARHPVETVIFIISLGLFAFAVYMLSPAYEGAFASPIKAGLEGRTQEYIAATVFLITSLFGLVAPIVTDGLSVRLFKYGSFFMFLDFLFLTFIRIIVVGWTPWTWEPTLMIAVIGGILRLFLEVKRD